MLSEISSHLLSHQASCQDVMASESPAEICLPSALLIHSSARFTLLITPALNHTRSAVTFWLYLLHQRHSMQTEFLQQFFQTEEKHSASLDVMNSSTTLHGVEARFKLGRNPLITTGHVNYGVIKVGKDH